MKSIKRLAALAGTLSLLGGVATAGCGTCGAIVQPLRPVVAATYAPCATVSYRTAPAIPDLSPPRRTSTPCGQPLLGVPGMLGEMFTPQAR